MVAITFSTILAIKRCYRQPSLASISSGLMLGSRSAPGSLIPYVKSTFMMGVGFEPIRHWMLRTKASAVLPRLTMIGCRERVTAPQILKLWGVDSSKIVVSADDAIEPAFAAHPEELGSGLGVNLRVADYSPVRSDTVAAIRTVLHRAVQKYSAPLIPVPISLRYPADSETIKALLKGYDDNSDVGASINTPQDVFRA